VIARHVGTAFTVARARLRKLSALMALILSEVQQKIHCVQA